MTPPPKDTMTAREMFKDIKDWIKNDPDQTISGASSEFLISLVEAAVEKWVIVHTMSLSEEHKEISRTTWWKEINQPMAEEEGKP